MKKGVFFSKIGLVVVIVLIALGFSFWSLFWNQKEKSDSPEATSYPEVAYLADKEMSFEDLSEYFTSLSSQKGAEYGFEVLRRATFPNGTDIHLLGHVVGDILYKQEGVDGIKVCTDEFRNACSHSIVVGVFSDEGDKALPKIASACEEAPGGKGAYGMCFHGLGHGILAANGYDLSKTSVLCEKTGTQRREDIECIGGMVMEIIGGGGHDKAIWARQRDKFLSLSDPLSICHQDYIPTRARPNCVNYLTPFLFEAVGGNIGAPTEANFIAAFKLCSALSVQGEREACFGGFGKEFVGLANSRDIRDVGNTNEQGLRQINRWCSLAADQDGIKYCLLSALNSIYWGGENPRTAAVQFCGLVSSSYQNACYQELIGAVNYYIDDKKYIQDFCNEIPQGYRSGCSRKG